MSRSVDETRRDFLLRLARSAAFVPPALLTLDVSAAAAQGKGNANSAAHAASSVVGSLTPTAPQAIEQQLQLNTQSEPALPWAPGSGAESPPWSQPPPTSSGG